MQISIKFLLLIIAVSILCGFIGGDRLRAFKAGRISDSLRSELTAERDRNTELEELHRQDGIELDEMGKELSDVTGELQSARGFINSLADLQFDDVSTIKQFRSIIADLRAKIEEAQEYNHSSGGSLNN